VVENPTINAFAVPGGVVGHPQRPAALARHEDELASVIAHELAHLSQRHFARGVEEARSNAVPNMLALLGSLVVAATAGGNAGMAAITATQAAIQQQQLRFSRAHETRGRPHRDADAGARPATTPTACRGCSRACSNRCATRGSARRNSCSRTR
jgi:predicted Zn-dependent protease